MQPRARSALLCLVGVLALCAYAVPVPPAKVPAVAPAKVPPKPAKIDLLLFCQQNCPPCRQLEAVLKSEAVAAELSARFTLIEVDFPDDRFATYGVDRTPTLVADAPGGAVKRIGSGAPATILQWLQSIGEKPALEARPGKPRSKTGIVEGTHIGPGGIEVQVDMPPEFWKRNITSMMQGCCVHRSLDFAAHWQNVRVLWGFPEWVRSKHLPGGADPQRVRDRIAGICKDRGQPEPDYVQYEAKRGEKPDPAILLAALATGRLPCIDYLGRDGVHYKGRIAHMVCLAYLDDSWACILDNNYDTDHMLWLPRADFDARWPGWAVVLLDSRPPAPPHN